eukprot:15085777-Heterocapsa_arctica.AAC.1
MDRHGCKAAGHPGRPQGRGPEGGRGSPESPRTGEEAGGRSQEEQEVEGQPRKANAAISSAKSAMGHRHQGEYPEAQWASWRRGPSSPS